MLEKYDKFIDLLPKLMPLFLGALFLGWLLMMFLSGETTTVAHYFSKSYGYSSGSGTFLDDVISTVPVIFGLTLFYLCEKFVQLQRGAERLIKFLPFAKKIQSYGLRWTVFGIVTALLVSVVQETLGFSTVMFHGDIIPAVIFLPFLFPIVSFWCFVYSVTRYLLLFYKRI